LDDVPPCRGTYRHRCGNCKFGGGISAYTFAPNQEQSWFLKVPPQLSNIVLDTSSVATDTIDYVATDTDGLTATSTRTVIIDAATAATSTTQ
jgi:hypothetical protein